MFDKTIDALGRRLGTDIRYAIHGISWLTVGQIASAGSSFALALAFANLLPPTAYGTYKYVLAVAAMLAVPALSGINNALVQAIAAHKEGTVPKAFTAKLRYGLIGSLGALIGSTYYLLNDNATLAACFAAVAVFIPLMEAFGLFDSILQGRQEFKRSVIIDATLQVLVVAGIVAVVFVTKNVVAIIAAYFALWTIGRAVSWYYVRTFLPKDRTEEDPRTIRFGWHLSLMNAGGVVAQYADQILLFQHIGSAELALYSISIAIPEQIKSSFKGIYSLILPRYSQQSPESIRATIWHKASLLTFIAVSMTVGYIIVIPWALPLFFPKYAGAVFYTQLFALSFVSFVSGIFTTALQAMHKTRELYAFNIMQPIVQIIAVAIGVLWFGILGAIIARVATRLIMFTASIILYQRSA